jgi:hypothetical protein
MSVAWLRVCVCFTIDVQLYVPRDVYHIEPRLSYSTYPEDQYEQQVVDPRYTRHMQSHHLRKVSVLW